MISLTNQDGQTSSLFRISWPVFETYKILPLTEYISFMESQTGRKLSDDDKSLLRYKRENFDHTYAIFPYNTEIKYTYNPLVKTPNAFLDLGKVINNNLALAQTKLRPTQKMPKIQGNILKWVSKYGLPYSSTITYNPSYHSTIDDVRKAANEIESFLERRLGQYAMLQETFLALACEARLINEVFLLEKKTNVNNEVLHDLVPIINIEEPIDRHALESQYSLRSKVTDHIRAELLKLLQTRLNGYSRQVALSLGIKNDINTPIKYFMKFDIPDLLTALWYQFYTLLTNTSNFKVCEECGQLFVPKRRDQRYCPPFGRTQISQCRSRHNKKLHDHPELKEPVDTQTE